MDIAATIYAPPGAKAPWRLEDLYAPAAVRHYAFGRQALADALHLAGAAGQTVLLPSFICREALSAVVTAGAHPEFYAVAPNLTPQNDQATWPNAKVVVVVDYFGWPQELAPFETYARRTGAIIVEDAAHALFSRDDRACLLGTRAPLGVLSPRKSLPLPNGGTLLATPEFSKLLPPQANFASAPDRRPALKAAARPLLAFAGAKASRALLAAWRAAKPEVPETESFMPETAPCPELGRPIVAADPAIEISRRRALWSLCSQLAAKAGTTPVCASLSEGVAPYAFAFRAKDSSADHVFTAEGLPILPWPDLPPEIGEAPEHYRDVRLVHFLW